MKQVIISFDADGKPYVVSGPKKLEVIFREPKQITWKRRLKRIWYKIKNPAV